MQELDTILAYLVDNVDGALSVAIGAMDGLLVEQYPQQGVDLSAMAAEETKIITTVQNAFSGALESGDIREIIITSEKLIGYTRVISEDLFCLLTMNPSGNIGKARLYVEQAIPKVLEVLT